MIYLGADHGGYQLKEKVKQWFDEWGHEYEDLGAHALVQDDDYPQYAFAVAEKVSREDNMTDSWAERSKGIIICRSAAGVAIAANKVKDIRAAAIYSVDIAKHAREHDDANVLCLSGDFITDTDAKTIVKTWLETDFLGEDRYVRRINQIREREYECGCGGSC